MSNVGLEPLLDKIATIRVVILMCGSDIPILASLGNSDFGRYSSPIRVILQSEDLVESDNDFIWGCSAEGLNQRQLQKISNSDCICIFYDNSDESINIAIHLLTQFINISPYIQSFHSDMAPPPNEVIKRIDRLSNMAISANCMETSSIQHRAFWSLATEPSLIAVDWTDLRTILDAKGSTHYYKLDFPLASEETICKGLIAEKGLRCDGVMIVSLRFPETLSLNMYSTISGFVGAYADPKAEIVIGTGGVSENASIHFYWKQSDGSRT